MRKKSVYYKASRFINIAIVIIAGLPNRFVCNRRRLGRGIGSLGELRGAFANIAGLSG